MTTTTKAKAKAIKQTTQVNEALATAKPVVMPANILQEIIAKAVKADAVFAKADKAHKSIYTECAASLRSGIESAVCSDIMLKEYDRRRSEYVAGVITARLSDYAGEDKKEVFERARLAMMQGIKVDNVKAYWISPKSETVKEAAKLESEKARAEINRTVEKLVKVAIKKQPNADEKALRTAIKQEVMAESKEERDTKRETEAFIKSESVFIDKLRGLNVTMAACFMGDVREDQLRLAALIASLMDKQTKAG